jgi:hypothetical protein
MADKFANLVSAAAAQAKATGAGAIAVADDPPATDSAPEAVAPDDLRSALGFVNELRATTTGGHTTFMGVPLLLPQGSEDDQVAINFRGSRALREAVSLRARQYGLTAEQFYGAAARLLLAQMALADSSHHEP